MRIDLNAKVRTRDGADVGHITQVIFDPEKIIDSATFDDPHQYPVGIDTVLVNGVTVIDGGEHTGALPGRLLRRHGTVCT